MTAQRSTTGLVLPWPYPVVTRAVPSVVPSSYRWGETGDIPPARACELPPPGSLSRASPSTTRDPNAEDEAECQGGAILGGPGESVSAAKDSLRGVADGESWGCAKGGTPTIHPPDLDQ